MKSLFSLYQKKRPHEITTPGLYDFCMSTRGTGPLFITNERVRVSNLDRTKKTETPPFAALCIAAIKNHRPALLQ